MTHELLPFPTQSSGLQLLVEKAQTFISKARSEATQRQYAASWDDFEGWTAAHGLGALPADPSTVALFIADRSNLAASTLAGRLAAINSMHRINGYPDSPASRRHVVVRETLKGVLRAIGATRQQHGKDPLLGDDVRRILATCPGDIVGLRNRCLLLVLFGGALRRSEAAALEISDVTFRAEGAVLEIRQSKAQEPGTGYQIPLPWGANQDTCVVTALRRWLDVLRGQFGPQVSGPLFRAVSVTGRISLRGLNKDSVGWLIKNMTRNAGLDPAPLGAHSCRAGHITQAIRAGVPEAIVMLQSRHKNIAVFRKYVRKGKLFTHTSAAALGM
jgi:integrase